MDKETEDRIDSWLNGPIDPETKAQIQALSASEKSDAFYKHLEFGTGGLRGLMGPGTNRMNIYTVQMATQGLAKYILQHPPERDRHYVFISYDCRNHSKEFALNAARVLAGNGIGVYLTHALRPTPYVSFGVRQKECTAGIMITASHNPKEYNGYKVYWADGGQVTAPHDKGIVTEANAIQDLGQIKLAPENSPLIQLLDPEFDLEYLAEIKKLQLDPKEDKMAGDHLKITYTPLHGAGNPLVPQALKSFGFTNINPVDHQILPDGNFPTVPVPNPEDPKALAMGIKQLQDTQSDILIATDPDADRMAVVALHHDKPHILSGNQIAILCLEYICHTLKSQNKLPANGAAVTTIVSTDLFPRIAAYYNLACPLVLTGFKYISELIHKWEQDRSHTFLFGAEESYGYLYGTHSRDKDAIIASCLIAELALLMKVEGRTLIDALMDLYKTHGLYYADQKVLSFPPGREGMEQMTEIMDNLRKNPPQEILGQKVTLTEDYLPGLKGLPPSNVLLYRLEDDTRIIARPSGTEPKVKIYGSVKAALTKDYDTAIANCTTKLDQLLTAFNDHLHQP